MNEALYPIPILIITVAFLIRAELRKKKRQIYVLKPLATLTVIAVALLAALDPGHHPTYTWGVLVGLLLSLGGDVALMFEGKRAFTLGLGLFLLAHVAYTVVFAVLGHFSLLDLLTALVLLGACAAFYRLIRANLGSMRGAVIAYMIIISLMVTQAVSTLASPTFAPGQAVMIAVGAVLFFVSDIILAAARFWRPWRYDRISLAFYYGGQLLIALAASYFA
jgi:uncharacterized membrane protein YhhN